MATKKVTVEIPEVPAVVETTDKKLPVRRVLKTYEGGGQVAACGKCGARLVNVEERIKCKFCWNCGTPVIWR